MLPKDHWDDLARTSAVHASSLGRLQLFAEIARLGFGYVEVIRDVAKVRGEPDKPLYDQLEEYTRGQAPHLFDLHALAAVRVWATLEAFIADVCRLVLQSCPDLLQSPDLARIKIPLSLAFSTGEDSKAEMLLTVIENHVDARLKTGVGRFEAALNLLGAGGPVEKTVRDALFECSKYRNCIVHSDGLIDQALCDAIPAFSTVKGTRLGVTPIEARRFLFASFWYMLEVQRRLLEPGFPRLNELQQEQQEHLQWLENPKRLPESMPFPLNPTS